MSTIDLSVQTSVLALVRGDVTASFVADRFGVTEAQVHESLFQKSGWPELESRL
jgi:hypothetical protein